MKYYMMSKTKTNPEGGNAIVTVMVVMVVIMLLVSALVEHLASAEADAVAESLAKIRIYWAMRGRLDYALSRAKATNIGNLTADNEAPLNSGDINDRDKIKALTDFNGELNSAIYPISYDEYGNSYTIDVTATFYPFFDPLSMGTPPPTTKNPGASGDKDWANANLGGSYTYENNQIRSSYTYEDGRISIIYSLGTIGSSPILQDIATANRAQRLRIDLCMGSLAATSRTMGKECVIPSGTPPNTNTKNDTGTNGISTIERMTLISEKP